MTHQLGTAENPLRVAIIGAGPAGFYAAGDLLKRKPVVEIDIYDRLPTPYGLVRSGIAPDHSRIKMVSLLFDRIAQDPGVHFIGNVEFGRDIHVEDLRRHYHQIIYSTGAPSDRSLGIPGEDLVGSHPATDFVAWYNGHPDYHDLQFDLSVENAVIVGVGNVALDVARILSRTPDELATTDVADYALEAFRQSCVKHIYILGRRGPAQVKFTLAEIKEFADLEDAHTVTLPEEMALDPLSQAELEKEGGWTQKRIVEVLQGYSQTELTGRKRQVTFRFLVSPVELIGNDEGRLTAVKLEKNELFLNDRGDIKSRATGQFEMLDAGLVFRSIGYRGTALPGVPFNERWGVILNDCGRVLDPATSRPVLGEYTAGWIKRGPTGVVGTNKQDAAETVKWMMADFEAGRILRPPAPQRDALMALIQERQPHHFTFEDWLVLDKIEQDRGSKEGRPRVKFTTKEEMIAVLAREKSDGAA